MDNNIGSAKNNSHLQNSVLTSHLNNMPDNISHHSERMQGLNANDSFEEEVEEKVVAKAWGELDADILQAMEKLSITDDDIKSSASEDQNNQNLEEDQGKILEKFKNSSIFR